ncbi:peptidase inhibitor family I36 protein [Kitasatospora purpeofusca]|uniref:peptidase inhibitor family I36 protein n=1 Tax=Kitasatospora purpeofusca TaxID=67352 RepID=UPI00367C1AC9
MSSTKRTLKRAVTAAVALAGAATLALTPTTAGATTTGNNDGASVGGVQGHPADPTNWDCAAGNVCLYTGTGWQGTRFDLFYYQTYSLANWNGAGSWFNNQTGGAFMKITDASGHTIRSSYAVSREGSFDFNPAWYVTLCQSAC